MCVRNCRANRDKNARGADGGHGGYVFVNTHAGIQPWLVREDHTHTRG